MNNWIAPISFAIIAAFGLTNCGNCDKSSCEKSKTTCKHASPSVSSYGEEFSAEQYADFTAEVNLDDAYFTGTIVQSCEAMGCWMTVEGPSGDTNMVYMLDHDFFVPKTGLGGLTCRIHGHAFYDTVSVEMRQHYAEDAGRTQEEIEAITEPSFELGFVAYGVEIDGVGEDNSGQSEDKKKTCTAQHEHEQHSHETQGH
ncbi:MAG: DUF4920 domain-containing protein [Flavobacteriales bacterium]|nr:DUF4920 domain-containing protein [Flavobacteriales bacterium]